MAPKAGIVVFAVFMAACGGAHDGAEAEQKSEGYQRQQREQELIKQEKDLQKQIAASSGEEKTRLESKLAAVSAELDAMDTQAKARAKALKEAQANTAASTAEAASEHDAPPPEQNAAAETAARLASLTTLKETKPKKTVESGEVKVKVTATKTGKTWKFDRSGYKYMVREADKDSSYHWLDLAISTKAKDPKLPGFFACRFSKEGEFEGCDQLRLEFYRWDDYSTYLGNYKDSGNDFAKKETVKFTAGYSATQEQLEQPAIVVLTPSCHVRDYKRFRGPDEFYTSTCTAPTLAEIGDLPIVDVLNKKALRTALDAGIATMTADAQDAGDDSTPPP